MITRKTPAEGKHFSVIFVILLPSFFLISFAIIYCSISWMAEKIFFLGDKRSRRNIKHFNTAAPPSLL